MNVYIAGTSPNVRLVDSMGRVDSSWRVLPSDQNGVRRSFELLAEYRREEPDAEWRLETRGEIADWHSWEI